jgi:cytochrome c-type biogenesis protein CcmH
VFLDLYAAAANRQLSIAGLAACGVNRPIGASPRGARFTGTRLMTLWFVFALMTAAAIFAVLWPLGRAARPQNDGNEAVVYKDQLAEIDRDVAAGLIGASEAGAARVEIGRRLLAATDSQRDPPIASNIRLRRSAAVLALVGVPIVAVALYLPLGSPRLGDFPLAQRTRAPNVAQPLDNLVAQVEAHLEKNPTDGRGWNVLAPVLVKLGRYDDAVRAYHNSITYNGDSAARRADLGEALAAAAGGVVTDEAKAEFERAIVLNADEFKATYFLGVAAEQDGRTAEAGSLWRAMLAKAPADAPWRPMVQAALARVAGSTAPALSDGTVAAAKDMNETDRGAMIRGMVERLASRLKQNGDDVEGWLRLVRAYMVMGDRDKARSALADARQAVANDAERLRQLNDGLKNLGLDG